MDKLKSIALAFLICVFGSNAFAQSTYDWHELILRGDIHYNEHVFGGSFVQRADGQMLITYRIKDEAMLSTVDSEATLLNVSDASRANEKPFYGYYTPEDGDDLSRTFLQKLDNGQVLLYIVEAGKAGDKSKPFAISVFESADGLGDDFVEKSTIYKQNLPFYSFGDFGMGEPMELGGRILIPVAIPIKTGTKPSVYSSRLYCAISDDGGATWSFSQIDTDTNYRVISKGFAVAGGDIVVVDLDYYGSGTAFISHHAIDSLEGSQVKPGGKPSWTKSKDYHQKAIGDFINSHVFYGGDGYSYLLRDDGFKKNGLGRLYYVYRHLASQNMDFDGQAPYKLGPIGSGATWEGPLNSTAYGDDALEYFSVTPSGDLAFYGTTFYADGANSHMYVGEPANH